MASSVIQTGSDDSDEQVERNPDTLPTHADPSGICPRCERNSNFDVVGQMPLVERSTGSGSVATERVVVLQCHGCKKSTLVVETYERGPGGMYSRPGKWIGTLWYPITGAVIDMSDVPPNLVSAFQEGVRCVSVEAPHAAVAMFRNALAQIVQDKGSEEAKKKDTLNLAVKQMVADRTLHDGFKEWADHVRKVGNAGAHQESWDEIPLEQAQELQDLVQHLIDTLYVQPAKLRRAMPAKKRPKP